MKRLQYLLLLALPLFFSSCNSKNIEEARPKYIFYMIGDGFGLNQSFLPEYYLDAKSKDTSTCHLDILTLPVLGTATTYSASSFITCSSAAGTALATGYKTNNGCLGVLPDGKTPVTSIAKKLHDEGYNVGIISTVSSDHATPAAFYAHVESRNMYKEISYQLKDVDYEYIAGASLRGAKKMPGIYDTLRNNGFVVSNDKDVILNHKLSDGKLFAYHPTADEKSDIPYCIDTKDDEMHLPFYVNKAIELFENDNKGFFMMIEGSQIDYACHQNDPGATLHEALDFNDAFKLVYDFYLRHKDETLIVITADHETGGLSIGQESKGYTFYPDLLDYQKISGDKFKEILKGIKNDDKQFSEEDLYALLNEYFGFNNEDERMALNKQDSLRIEYYYLKYFKPQRLAKQGDKLKTEIFKTDVVTVYDIAGLALKIMSEKVGIGWTTTSHNGCAVPVRAIGVWQEKFGGCYDNTDIPKKIYGDK